MEKKGVVISITTDYFTTEIKINSPLIIQYYEQNPQRVINYLIMGLSNTAGNILSGQNLDKAITEIEKEAISKKLNLGKTSDDNKEIN